MPVAPPTGLSALRDNGSDVRVIGDFFGDDPGDDLSGLPSLEPFDPSDPFRCNRGLHFGDNNGREVKLRGDPNDPDEL